MKLIEQKNITSLVYSKFSRTSMDMLRPKLKKRRKNIFFLCYSCAFDSATIGKAERSRAPSLLFQAYKLKVPEKHLVGFILQHSIPKKDEFQFVYNRSPQKAK